MNSYFFEIVERSSDRYSWVLVIYRKGRRRVIARAYRDYRSPGKAARAAEALQKVVGDAEIVCAFPQAPDHTFQILRDVLPLVVGSVESAEDFRWQPPQSSVIPSSSANLRRPTATRAARLDDGAPARAGVGAGEAAPAGVDGTPPETAAALAKEPAPAEEKPPTRTARPRKQQTPRAERSRAAAKATAQS